MTSDNVALLCNQLRALFLRVDPDDPFPGKDKVAVSKEPEFAVVVEAVLSALSQMGEKDAKLFRDALLSTTSPLSRDVNSNQPAEISAFEAVSEPKKTREDEVSCRGNQISIDPKVAKAAGNYMDRLALPSLWDKICAELAPWESTFIQKVVGFLDSIGPTSETYTFRIELPFPAALHAYDVWVSSPGRHLMSALISLWASVRLPSSINVQGTVYTDRNKPMIFDVHAQPWTRTFVFAIERCDLVGEILEQVGPKIRGSSDNWAQFSVALEIPKRLATLLGPVESDTGPNKTTNSKVYLNDSIFSRLLLGLLQIEMYRRFEVLLCDLEVRSKTEILVTATVAREKPIFHSICIDQEPQFWRA